MNFYQTLLKLPFLIFFFLTWSEYRQVSENEVGDFTITEAISPAMNAPLTPMLVIYKPGTKESSKERVRKKYAENEYVLYQYHEICPDYPDKEVWYIAYEGKMNGRPGPKSETESDDDVAKVYVETDNCELK